MYVLYTFCIHVEYLLYNCYIHAVYKVYTSYMHFIHIIYTKYTTVIDFLGHFLEMFRTSLGVENEVFPKSFGDVWAIIWHHRRCLGRGLKILKKCFFTKK